MKYFNFVLRDGMDDVVRKMNREQYKAHRHLFRSMERATHKAINWDLVHQMVRDMMCCGSSHITTEDMLK